MTRLALLGLALAACTSGENLGTSRAQIVKGTESDDTQNSTVLVMHYDALAAGGGAASGCTGTLLAPTLVLTARHCIAKTDDGAACNGEGKAVEGGNVLGDHDPSKIYVFGGRTRPDFLGGKFDPSRGKEILSNGSTSLCNADIALLVLDKPVTGAVTAPVRLDGSVDPAETFTVVGWGISDKENNPETRQQRTGVTVVDVGPKRDLGPTELRLSEGTCSGDSGGPAISAQGAVIGALSRGGNGTKNVGAEACLGGTNVFTTTMGHADLIRSAYARVNVEPWLEGRPMPLPDAGAPAGASPPDEDDGCNAVHGSTPSGITTPGVLFTMAVLFGLGRRRNYRQNAQKHWLKSGPRNG